MKLQKLWQTRSSKQGNIPLIGLLWVFMGSQWGMAQCGFPELPGVPDAMEMETSYVRTTTTQTLFPSTKLESNYNDLDHAITKDRILIEKFYHGKNNQDNAITVREVLNPTEYFPSSVYPYSHSIINHDKGSIYNDSLRLSSFDVPFQYENSDSISPENTEATLSLEQELGMSWDENGLLTYQAGSITVVVDTLNHNRMASRLDSAGELAMMHFTQFDPSDRERITPIFEVRLEKSEFVNSNGECTYELMEKKYSRYCRVKDSNNVDSNIYASKFKSPEPNLIIYPNPARDQVRVEIGSKRGRIGDIQSLEILNASGQNLTTPYSKTTSGLMLDVHHLNVGLYILRLKVENKTFISKFVKL
jgi:hypothetical protein